jgi:hypothetical protein
MDMTAMDWGVRFEPIVKQILTVRWGAEILEFGRLLHPTDPRLAASPDGILIAAADPARIGRLVEIKCPIRREITGAIPYEYWCQMQIQMEVCDIDECEYVEAKINSGYKGIPFCEAASAATKAASAATKAAEAATKAASAATKAAEAATKAASAATNSANSLREQYAGTLWLLQEPTTLELKYAYMALERKDLERCGWNVIEEIPWNLDALSIQVVARDRAWFASTAEARDAFWTKVEDAKAGTFVLPPSSRPARVPKGAVVQVCKIED